MRRLNLFCGLVVLLFGAGSVSAAYYHVAIDLTGLGGSNLQLQAAFYDNSGVIGDSWVLMDNVTLGLVSDDFEDGILGGFDSSLNPDSVDVVAGSLNGTGSYVMRIDEDPTFTPTIVFRDYLSPGSSMLAFDFEMTASSIEGSLGFDELVISLLDPDTLDPLVPGLYGFGDVLTFSAEGLQYSSEVSVPAIPVPGALVLVALGTGIVRFRRIA